MVLRDLANFKAQDLSIYMYIPTLVIRGFFLPMESLRHPGQCNLVRKIFEITFMYS